MSDHDFEKQVQLRMEQLRLRPSDAVWMEVEKNIRREKRRRRMIIWLPLLLLVLGAGGYFAVKETARPAKEHLVKQSTPSSSSSTQNDQPSTSSSTQIQENTLPSANAKTNEQAAAEKVTASDPVTTQKTTTGETTPATGPATGKTPTAKAIVPDASAATDKVVTDKIVTTRPVKTPHKKIIRKPLNNDPVADLAPAKKPVRKVRSNKQQADNKPVITDQLADVPQKQTGEKNDTADLVTTDATKQAELMPDTAVAITSVTAADSSLAQATPVDSVAKDTTQTVATAPAAPAPVVAKAKQEKKKATESKWQWGVQAEGGYSGVTKDGLFGFLEQGNTPVADLASPAFGNAMNYSPQFPRPVNKASNLTMGPAFSIGGFAQRTLSKRVSLSAGLQYTYLSSRQVVGTKINNNRTVNRVPATAQVVTEYYDANNTQKYTNRYHFIELPVTLHTQLNKGKRLPITWDIGFSVSKMLGTNALHYDGLGGVYYKDNALFNKTQWAASTGFNVKLFNQSRHPLSVGPVMRYNMTPLLQKDYSTGQHLWSVGLRASVLLKK